MNGSFYATIPGAPLPQGSKAAIIRGGKARVIDSNSHLKEWRMAITGWVLEALADQPEWQHPVEGPLRVEIAFLLRRPKYHYGTGANEHKIKPSSPIYPITPPDLDKLTRAILDGCTDANLWLDDKQVVDLQVTKRYARWDSQPGAALIVTEKIDANHS